MHGMRRNIATHIESVGRCNCIQGNAALPVPMENYWALTTYANTTSGNHTSRSLKIVDPPGVDPPIACPEAAICQADMALFWQCDAGHCKGGPNFECEER